MSRPMREIYHLSEQFKLLEDHMAELAVGSEGCPDCLWKHMNAIVGYAHEVSTLSETVEQKNFYQKIADEARNWRKAIFQVEANPEVLEKLNPGNPGRQVEFDPYKTFDGSDISEIFKLMEKHDFKTIERSPLPRGATERIYEKDGLKVVVRTDRKQSVFRFTLNGDRIYDFGDFEERVAKPGNPGIPEHCEFSHDEVKSKEYFDKKSFRTLCPESPTGLCKDLPTELACATRIIIGCKAGKYVKGRCKVGTEAHVIYHTKGVKG